MPPNTPPATATCRPSLPCPPPQCGSVRRSRSAAALCHHPRRCAPASARMSGGRRGPSKGVGLAQPTEVEQPMAGQAGAAHCAGRACNPSHHPRLVPATQQPLAPTLGLMSYTLATRMPRQRWRRHAASAATSADEKRCGGAADGWDSASLQQWHAAACRCQAVSCPMQSERPSKAPPQAAVVGSGGKWLAACLLHHGACCAASCSLPGCPRPALARPGGQATLNSGGAHRRLQERPRRRRSNDSRALDRQIQARQPRCPAFGRALQGVLPARSPPLHDPNAVRP